MSRERPPRFLSPLVSSPALAVTSEMKPEMLVGPRSFSLHTHPLLRLSRSLLTGKENVWQLSLGSASSLVLPLVAEDRKALHSMPVWGRDRTG